MMVLGRYRYFVINDFCFIFQRLMEDVFEFEGKVDLKNAKHIYHIIEYYGHHGSTPSEEPVDIYFGKWVILNNNCTLNFLSGQ